MSSIDTAVTSALASRIDSLLSIGTAATTTQAGASALNADLSVPANTHVAHSQAPEASSHTVLSAVAVTLDAITRSGGEATPAAIGFAPVWPAAPALTMAQMPLFDAETGVAAAGGAAASGGFGHSTAGGSAGMAAGMTAASAVSASQVPVAQLAAALEQTVADTGLFYESHLSDWLNGMRSPESLTSELQNRVAPAAQQLPLDWSADGSGVAGGAAGAGGMGSGIGSNVAGDVWQGDFWENGATAAGIGATDPMTGRASSMSGAGLSGMRPESPGNLYADAAFGARPLHSALRLDRAAEGAPNHAAQAIAASIHPATVPIVRQQLDLLATGQFRWTGEAWPGTKFDWVIEEDTTPRPRTSAVDVDDERPWRTRITLSLPSLGTVDADLTLTGTQLVARVQASPTSASRLVAQGESFRQRLADAGIALQGLTIREVETAPPAAAAQAASAYARNSAGAGPQDAARGAGFTGRSAAAQPPADDSFDWDMT